MNAEKQNSKKWIDVGCAIIERKKCLLLAQRKPGDSYGGFWEFPGGKQESGETIEECLCREALEELGVYIQPRFRIGERIHHYPQKSVRLHFYLCKFLYGHPVKQDCFNFAWVPLNEIRKFLILPADIKIIGDLLAKQAHYFR